MKNNISEEINRIFVERTGIDFLREGDKKELNLFGMDIQLEPRDLLLVYMDIKEKFHVNLSKEICDKQFKTFNKIVSLVERTCSQ